MRRSIRNFNFNFRMGFWKIIGKAERKRRVGLYYLYIERVVEAEYEAYRGLVRSKSQYELLVLRYAELCRG